MKTILYIGATLMIGASIYGFIDYKKTNHRKEFTTMYETKKPAATTTDNAESIAATPAAVKETAAQPATSVAEKPVEKNKIEVIPFDKNESAPVTINTSNKKEKPAIKKHKQAKKKKLDYKIFSRAPIREYEEPVEAKSAASKTEPATTENKKQ